MATSELDELRARLAAAEREVDELRGRLNIREGVVGLMDGQAALGPARQIELLEAMLESTADGLLIADQRGGRVITNRRFRELWSLTLEQARDVQTSLRLRAAQVVDPIGFLRDLAAIGDDFEREDYSLIELVDGRVFDRYSAPLRLAGEPLGRFWILRDVTERTRLDQRNRLLATAVAEAGEAVLITDRFGRVEYANPTFERLTGLPGASMLGQTPEMLRDETADPAPYQAAMLAVAAGQTWTGVLPTRRADGSVFHAANVIAPVRAPDGSLLNVVNIFRDVTREEQLEDEVRQAHKMDAVGRLAGGIAHDFNNLLTAILGTADLLREGLADEQQREELDEIRRAANRAATLTRQLLAFSRRQVLQPRALDLGQVLEGMGKMLRRLIPENVRVRTMFAPESATIVADPGQIEQVLLNLALNARDAMPRGGELVFGTDTVEYARPTLVGDVTLAPGRYVRLRVSDDGEGMDAATVAHVFEPFFTTKERGRGTGLGLATVYGIVRQSGGAIQVESRRGQGTEFILSFPYSDGRADDSSAPPPAPAASGPGSTVLLTEDEDGLRRVAARILRRAGYEVLEAQNGRHALEVARAHSGAIDALVTDVVMPELSGTELARRLMAERPGLGVLFISGHFGAALMSEPGEALPEGARLLGKPFTPDALRAELRALLEATSSSRS